MGCAILYVVYSATQTLIWILFFFLTYISLKVSQGVHFPDTSIGLSTVIQKLIHFFCIFYYSAKRKKTSTQSLFRFTGNILLFIKRYWLFLCKTDKTMTLLTFSLQDWQDYDVIDFSLQDWQDHDVIDFFFARLIRLWIREIDYSSNFTGWRG